MKKTAAILILLVFLFNVGGYYLLFLVLNTKADQALRVRLDANAYSPDETIELKLPVTLPYPLQDNGFARVDGKFEHKGQIFKLVKQKLEKDTLYIVCIRHAEEKNLRLAFGQYVKLTNDVPSSSEKSAGVWSKLISDFEAAEKNTVKHTTGWVFDIQSADPSFALITQSYPIFSPPPEV